MRVSADVDQSELKALMTFFNMSFRYGIAPKMWRTGYGGVHFIMRDLPIRWEEAFLERALFSDDESRVWLDWACKYKPMQTLFCQKGVDGRTRWREPLDLESLLAMPAWLSRIVRKPGRERGTRRRLARV